MKKILVTGAAGFIGFHLSKKLLERGHEIVGLDNINDYYDTSLKYDRLEQLGIDRSAIKEGIPVDSHKNSNFSFVKEDLANRQALLQLYENHRFDRVVNLAAQAGVRYSLQNPYAYLDSNLSGFLNILEACRHHKTEHLVYASSSSVYGLNETMPFSVHDNVDHPISPYSASKKSNELMAHTYSYLYQLPTTGLRFFTVYGPWGRPDMALFLFTRAIIRGEPIQVFNHGNMQRDFTYVDDIVDGIIRVLHNPPAGDPQWQGSRPDPSSSIAPYRIYNIGRNEPIPLMEFIRATERALGKKALMEFQDMQPGDVPKTWADVNDLIEDLDYRPQTGIETGIQRFIEWYRDYYQA